MLVLSRNNSNRFIVTKLRHKNGWIFYMSITYDGAYLTKNLLSGIITGANCRPGVSHAS